MCPMSKSPYIFSGHQTFVLRASWMKRLYDALGESPQILTSEDAVVQLVGDFVATGTHPDMAREQSTEIIGTSRRVYFDYAMLDSSGMFSVRDVAGVLKVTLNMRHPMYTYFYELFNDETSAYSDRERLKRAQTAFETLLFAWARLEDEAAGSSQKTRTLIRIREEWGDMAHEFLEQMDEHA